MANTKPKEDDRKLPESTSGAENLAGDIAENAEQKNAEDAIRALESDDIVTEGDLNAVRDATKVERVAGHAGSLAQWEASEEGKQFLAGEDDRQKQIKAEAKEIENRRQAVDRAQELLKETANKAQAQADEDQKVAQEQNQKHNDDNK